MRTEFERQLRRLNEDLAEMGYAIISSIVRITRALGSADIFSAQEVMDSESDIKGIGREIENRCMKLLMKQQPVAGDLRFISSSLKIETDMERIGRQVSDIAEFIMRLDGGLTEEEFSDLNSMGEVACRMVESSIKYFSKGDLGSISGVIELDDVVDNYFDKVKDTLIYKLKCEREDPERLIDLLMIAKYYERIGDHAENIARWVNYSITGKQY